MATSTNTFDNFANAIKNDPALQQMLVRFGLGLTQPIQPGQNAIGQIGGALAGSVDYLTQERRFKAQQAEEKRRFDAKQKLDEETLALQKANAQRAAGEHQQDIALEKQKIAAIERKKEGDSAHKRLADAMGIRDDLTQRALSYAKVSRPDPNDPNGLTMIEEVDDAKFVQFLNMMNPTGPMIPSELPFSTLAEMAGNPGKAVAFMQDPRSARLPATRRWLGTIYPALAELQPQEAPPPAQTTPQQAVPQTAPAPQQAPILNPQTGGFNPGWTEGRLVAPKVKFSKGELKLLQNGWDVEAVLKARAAGLIPEDEDTNAK